MAIAKQMVAVPSPAGPALIVWPDLDPSQVMAIGMELGIPSTAMHLAWKSSGKALYELVRTKYEKELIRGGNSADRRRLQPDDQGAGPAGPLP